MITFLEAYELGERIDLYDDPNDQYTPAKQKLTDFVFGMSDYDFQKWLVYVDEMEKANER